MLYIPFIWNFGFLSPVSWDLQNSKISPFTFKMFWFFSQTLASVLNAEWLKAVCSVRTVIVFKQGSLCLFKRMGKWLSWQIRLHKQDSHSLAQMSTFATWLAFWGILNKTCLCAGAWALPELCLTPDWGMWLRTAARAWVSLWAHVPRFEISQGLFNCVIIKLMEHKRNFSHWLEGPVPVWFGLPSPAMPVAALQKVKCSWAELWGDRINQSLPNVILNWMKHQGQLWLSGHSTEWKVGKPDSSPNSLLTSCLMLVESSFNPPRVVQLWLMTLRDAISSGPVLCQALLRAWHPVPHLLLRKTR